VVLAGQKVHILGTFKNAKMAQEAIVSLILGSPPVSGLLFFFTAHLNRCIYANDRNRARCMEICVRWHPG
jgi:rRNA processing protein Krr1/Pno1